MSLKDKIGMLQVLWDSIQSELLQVGGDDERINEASDDITFAVASLPVYLNAEGGR